MTAFLYLIEDSTNGFSYIGKTSLEPQARWKEHLYRALRGKGNRQPLLYNALRAHGTENFKFTVVEAFATDAEAQEAEKYWIARLGLNRSRDRNASGYNLTDGGDGQLGYKHDKERRRLQALKHKGFRHSEETKRKLSEIRKGKPFQNAGTFQPGRANPNKTPAHIRVEIRASQETHTALAKKYGLHRKTIAAIRKE